MSNHALLQLNHAGRAHHPAARRIAVIAALADGNIDAERDRIYLPQEDLIRFGVSEEDLKHGVKSERLTKLMRFETERATHYYEQAQKLFPLVKAAGRPTLLIMMQIYRGILDDIIRNDFDVYSQRARVSIPRKLKIVAEARIRSRIPGSI